MYYGFRFYGNRNTTDPRTGKIAGSIAVFATLNERENWINREKRGAPCGLGGGERDRMSRKEILKLVSIADFKDGIERVTDECPYREGLE